MPDRPIALDAYNDLAASYAARLAWVNARSGWPAIE
jgi:hypothetical protein